MADEGKAAGRLTGETERDGEAYRSVRVESKRLRSVYSRLEALMREPGYAVAADGSVSEWRIVHRAEAEDGAAFLGPSFPGRTLAEEISARSGGERGMTEIACAEGLSILGRVAEALAALEASGMTPERFIPDAIVVSDAGVLFLPVGIADVAGGEAPGPGHRGPAASFAAYLHRFALLAPGAALHGGGKGPGAEEAAEGIGLRTASPRLDPALAALIDRGIGFDGKSSAPSMAEWSAALATAEKSGWLARQEPAELEKSARRLAAAMASGGRRIAARAFINKRSLALGVIGVLAVGFLVIGVPPIARRASFARGVQALGPEQLVRTYYASIDSLDSEFIDVAARRKASSRDSEMVAGITVLTKYRAAMEGKEIRVVASEWLQEGKPSIEDSVLFGIAGLVLEPLDRGDPPSFVVRYSLWTTEPRVDETYGPVERVIEDRIVLERWGAGYRIASIERTGSDQ